MGESSECSNEYVFFNTSLPLFSSIPKSVQRCSTNISHSSNEPSSSKTTVEEVDEEGLGELEPETRIYDRDVEFDEVVNELDLTEERPAKRERRTVPELPELPKIEISASRSRTGPPEAVSYTHLTLPTILLV